MRALEEMEAEFAESGGEDGDAGLAASAQLSEARTDHGTVNHFAHCGTARDTYRRRRGNISRRE